MRITEILLGIGGDDEPRILEITPHEAGLTIVALEHVDPMHAAKAIVETLSSREPRVGSVIPFVKVTLESDRGRVVVADDAISKLKLFDGDGEAIEGGGEAEIDSILLRIATLFGVERDLIGPMLQTPVVLDHDAEPDELTYVEAVRRASQLADLVRAIDDRMTASVVPDWLWIATGFGGIGVLLTAIVLLYPESRIILIPALVALSIVAFGLYGWRSFGEITLRASLSAEREEARERREDARAEVSRLREQIAKDRDPDEILVRLKGASRIDGLPLVTASMTWDPSSLPGELRRPTIVFIRGPVEHPRAVLPRLSAITRPRARPSE